MVAHCWYHLSSLYRDRGLNEHYGVNLKTKRDGGLGQFSEIRVSNVIYFSIQGTW